MVIGQIKDGIVLDHITAGGAVRIYHLLGLEKLSCTVAMIVNAESKKMGRKDILKIDKVIDLDFDVLGYLDPGITINIIRDGKLHKRTHLTLPDTVQGLMRCTNPRCITSTEQELPHIFRLSDAQHKIYRCLYCDSAAHRLNAPID